MHTLDDLRAGRLRGITRLNLCQELTDFPREIFDLADSLEVLDLTGNRLSDLPADLHRLTRLKVLFCSNNRFTHLPHAIGRCQALETAGFRSNRSTPRRCRPRCVRWCSPTTHWNNCPKPWATVLTCRN
jgi:hypothetical protein